MYTLDGLPVVSAEVTLRRCGAWFARVEVDASERDPAEGRLRLDLGALRLDGTALADHAGSSLGRWRGLLVGGAGRFRDVLTPASYVAAPLRVPLADVLRATGDALSSDTKTAALATMLPAWSRDAAPAGAALLRLCAEGGFVWRTTPAGDVWVGADDFLDVTPDVAHELVEQDEARGLVVIATETPSDMLLPGTSFRGLRVERVVHTIAPSSTRTVVLSEADGAALSRLVKRATPPAFIGRHWARIVSQSADGTTVDVVPDDASLATYTRVPIAVPLPAATLRVPTGARVLLAFADGDAQRPYVDGWAHGSADLELDGVSGYAAKPVSRVGDAADAGTLRLTLAAAPSPPAPPGSQILTATYTPPGLASIPSVFSLLLPPGTSAVFPPTGDLAIPLSAVITSGCAGVLA